MKEEPRITVGIIDRQSEIAGRLNGPFTMEGFGAITGPFTAKARQGLIVLIDETNREAARSPVLTLTGGKGSTFNLFDVVIGRRFHWERRQDQAFEGSLVFRARDEGTMAAINEIGLEDYLKSVISSEMSARAPAEFLKTHAILSRSWLLAALGRAKKRQDKACCETTGAEEGEVVRWYEREEHDLYDVCADDHCQRYQGIGRITSPLADDAVRQTRGLAITYGNEVCDARYSKACGGITEDFASAWDDRSVPYLKSISDSEESHWSPVTEEEAERWILTAPDAYCNTKDQNLLEKILPDFDRETKDFFRWTVDYPREELEDILREKSGLDFGILREIAPLARGPSGRIYRARITGSKKSVVVGKELEIRRWLSRSHLYSSAFVVKTTPGPDGEVERFTIHGAGWGHGVGLCQVGAAVMAGRGFTAEEILKHYFSGVEITKVY